ncbi:hypothetical protein QQF64_003001 [Cirrhinus molitorella]|uniref:Uncharacterized protein n=1 Tax=Cirrhinus molitorella TaxID=172907 RepID=A0ABR3MKN2_9TELE
MWLSKCVSIRPPQLITSVSTDCQRKSNYAPIRHVRQGPSDAAADPLRERAADARGSLALSLPNRVFGGESENQNGFSAPSVQFGRGGLKGLRRRRGGSPRSISQRRGGIIEIHLIIGPSLSLNENCLPGSSVLIYAGLILSGPRK